MQANCDVVKSIIKVIKKKKEFFSYLPKQIVDQLGSSISSTTHNAQILCKDETTDVKIQNTFHTLTKMIDIL